MESWITYLVSIISILIEFIFILTAIYSLITIIKFEKLSNEKNIKSFLIKYFLIFSIIGEISYSFFSFSIIGKLIYCLFLIYELYFIINFISLTIVKRIQKLIIIISLILLAIPFSLYSFLPWFEKNINMFLSLESILIGYSCFIYFEELKSKIETIDLEKDINTLITIGLFFCYSAPLAFNSTIAFISFKFPNLIQSFSKNELILYLGVSRIGTVCYIIFHYFIYKAFKWKSNLHIGV